MAGRISDGEYKKLIQSCFPAFDFQPAQVCGIKTPDLISKAPEYMNKILVECGSLSCSHSGHLPSHYEKKYFEGFERFEKLFYEYPEATEIWWFPHPENNTLGGLLWFRCVRKTFKEEEEEFKRVKEQTELLYQRIYELKDIRKKLIDTVKSNITNEVAKALKEIDKLEELKGVT